MRFERLIVAVTIGVALFGMMRPRCAMAQDERRAAGIEFFEKRIRPVLVTHCYECHSADKKKKGGLVLTSRATIRRGGDTGPAVVPGKPDESQLIDAMRYESFEMPPKGKLPAAVIADFVKWIRIGAPDPRDGDTGPIEESEASYAEARQYWSYQPIIRPAPPVIEATAWPQSDIDRLILARLESAGLSPTEDAARDVLLRRVYFSLIGLPPSPEEVEAFVNSSDPQAFERVVDRLLQSPRFGEKFGRHWLDVVRFSESSGGGRTRIFQEAWRYRDYVIDAFNQDKPFDQFIAEQIAGDLLPTKSVADAKAALTATSLMSIGPINYELQDKELLDMEVVDEQLTVIGKAFMGMTIGCARCHDHKFDPIPTRDYYALAGILKSTKTLNHANVSNPVMRPLPANDQQKQLLAAYAARIAPVQKEIKSLDATLKKLNGQQVATAQKSIPRDQVNGLSVDETEARLIGKWVSSASVAGFVGKAYHYTSDRNAAAHYEFKPGDRGKVEVRLSYTANPNRASNVTVEIWHAGEQTVRKVDMKKAPGIDGSFVSLGTFEFKDSLKVIIKGTGSNGVVIADCVQVLAVSDAQKAGGLASVRGGKGVSKTSKPNASEPQRKEIESRLAELRKQLKDMQKDAPSPVPVVMSVEEAAKPGNCHLCIRGNVHNPGVEVPRGFLSIMTGGKPAEIPDGASGRREFAEWIAGPDNTLTSRVIANRVWYWLTGVGLVRTTDNFGITGETPSHPKLLDWLATELHANGWSIRHLIRTIVLSRTWRLASEPSQAALRIDPDNRLLSHAHRRRLEAESIRDGILSVSGQLDLTAGGSTIRPGSTTEFNYRFNDASLDGRRRSVYVPVFRNTLLDLFEVFDFADPNLTRGRRTTSTLPTQGLYLMNSPWVIEQSQHAAERLLAIEGLSDGERLERAHLQFFGRLPTPAERRLAEQYLAAATDEADRIQVWSELCHVMIASIDFRYLR